MSSLSSLRCALSPTLDQRDAVLLADALGDDETLGCPPAAAVETSEGRWQVEATFAVPPNWELLAAIAQETLGRPLAFRIEDLPDRDWVAESLKGLDPVRAGRFFVHGSHDRENVPPGAIAIEIEAGRAFGTGHHGTTKGCLSAIDNLLKKRRFSAPLDLGTGSGVLAIALAKALKVAVLASDIDPLAVEIARANAAANGVGTLIDTVTAAGLAHRRFAGGRRHDLIVANILARPLAELAGEIAARLKPGGVVVVSGLLVAQEAFVAAAYRNRGLALKARHRRGEWSTLVFSR